VNDARADLQDAVRDEIDETEPSGPGLNPVTLPQKVETGQGIIERFASDDVLYSEVERAVGTVIVDIEVEETVDFVAAASSSDVAYGRLADRYGTVSDEAQLRLLQEETVQEVLDDVVETATEPLATVATDSRPSMRVYDATERVENLVDEADNPDLAAEIVLRAQPAFDQALRDGGDRSISTRVPLVNGQTMQSLGRISDSLTGARREGVALRGMAEFAIAGADDPVFGTRYIPNTSDGTGLPLALEVVRQLEADPDVDAAPVMDEVIDNFEDYLEGPVGDAIEDYSDHTEELNFYVASFPTDLPPERLQGAIAEYIENKGPEWQEDFDRLFGDVGAHGVNVLRQREMIGAMTDLTEDGEEKLTDAASGDEFRISTEIAAQSRPEELVDIDINSAIEFVDGLGIADNTVSLRRSLANAHVQGDDRNGPISPDDIQQQYQVVEEKLDDLSAFPANEPLGFAFRSLGLAVSAQSAYGSTRALIEDPSLGNAVTAAVDGITFAQSSTEFATELGLVADDAAIATRFGSNATVGKLLGVAGLAFGTVGVISDIRDGDHIQAGLGAAGVGGGALALFGTASWAGPVGIGIAAVAAVGSLGVNQYRNVSASNDYTGQEARDFFAHAGFDADAARALADRSGEGYSPIPILMQYGQEHGLTPQETIDWMNSLDKSDLDFARDRFHHTLDDIDGDLSEFAATHEDDQSRINQFERRARRGVTVRGTPISVATADWILDARNITLPS